MRNHRIDYLKCLCAIFVIMDHSIFYLTEEYGCSFPSIFGFITAPIYAHVPMFIAIAGYLCHEQDHKPYYKKKFDKIIIPFFVFSLLKLLYSAFVSNDYSHADSLLRQVFDAYILGGLYWFSYCIFIIFCLAPFLWAGEKKYTALPFLLLFALICISIVDYNTDYLSIVPYFQIRQVIRYSPYFLIGYIAQSYQNKITSWIKSTNTFIIILIFSLLYLINYYMDNYTLIRLHYLFSFIQKMSVLIVLYMIVSLLKPNAVVRKIASYSYQLMLLDSFVRVVILKLINRCFVISPYWMIPQTILSVVCCVIICEVFSRWKAARYLLGL